MPKRSRDNQDEEPNKKAKLEDLEIDPTWFASKNESIETDRLLIAERLSTSEQLLSGNPDITYGKEKELEKSYQTTRQYYYNEYRKIILNCSIVAKFNGYLSDAAKTALIMLKSNTEGIHKVSSKRTEETLSNFRLYVRHGCCQVHFLDQELEMQKMMNVISAHQKQVKTSKLNKPVIFTQSNIQPTHSTQPNTQKTPRELNLDDPDYSPHGRTYKKKKSKFTTKKSQQPTGRPRGRPSKWVIVSQ